jgi:acetyltransferase-like isoleucine patch superfamily enzyme
LVGAGAVILPYLTIGNHVTIAAGATVTHDLPDYSTFPSPM